MTIYVLAKKLTTTQECDSTHTVFFSMIDFDIVYSVGLSKVHL